MRGDLFVSGVGSLRRLLVATTSSYPFPKVMCKLILGLSNSVAIRMERIDCQSGRKRLRDGARS